MKPELVLVVGDTNSALGVALAAAKLNVPVAHVEAGLRSFDRSMPEEVNRVVIDSVASHFFASESSAVENLGNEGHPAERIHYVGNVMVDSLRLYYSKAVKSEIGNFFKLCENKPGKAREWKRYAMLTMHRPSNTGSLEKLNEITLAVKVLGLPTIFPVHPRGVPVEDFPANIVVVEPLGYLDFICLVAHASVVLTDSGGVQDETTALGVPCLTLRDNTERPLTVERGTNMLVGTNSMKIIAAGRAAMKEKKKSDLPWSWDGHAAERIVQILESVIIPKSFTAVAS